MPLHLLPLPRAPLALLADLFFALAACAAPPADAPALGQQAAPVVNGQEHHDDPAVVFIFMEGLGSCSGTLVSPTVVLTARHCVIDSPFGSVTVYFGDGWNGFPEKRVESAHYFHPDADIAVIILAEPAPANITPIPVGTEYLELHVGEPVRFVGFGVTSTDGSDAGVKRLGRTKLPGAAGGLMFMQTDPSNTCFGDSGGPDFMTFYGIEFVVGVNSFVQGGCGMTSGSVRPDAFTEWLSQYFDTQWDKSPPVVSFVTPPGNVLPGAELELLATDDRGVRQVSLVVNGTPSDVDFFPPFELALPDNLPAGAHTIQAKAVDVGGNESIAELAITIPMGCSTDIDCAADQACAEGVCSGALGAACNVPTDCASGQCFVPLGRNETAFCTKTCASAGECPADFACAEPPGAAVSKCMPGAGDGGLCAIAPASRGRGLADWALLGLGAALLLAARARRRAA